MLGRGIPRHSVGKELEKLLGDSGSGGCRGKWDKPAGSTFGLEIQKGLSPAVQGSGGALQSCRHVMSRLAIAILDGNQSCINWGEVVLPCRSHQAGSTVGASSIISVPMMFPLPHAAGMALTGVLRLSGTEYVKAQRTPSQCWW